MGFNLKNIELSKGGTTFESLPEGLYVCEVSAADLTKSKNGNDMINITFKVKEGDHKNRLLWDRMVIMDNTLAIVKSRLKKMGSNLADSDNVEPSDIAEDLVGRSIKLFVEPSTTNTGKPSNDIKEYHSVIEAEADEDPLAAAFGKQ